MSLICLGEALVDLVCERPVAGLGQADAFVPHFGGACANVAVTAARHGARVWLAGGAGDDPWGHWLRDRLELEGVELDFFSLAPELPTPLAFVSVAESGEPSFAIYGDSIASSVAGLEGRLDEVADRCDALFFGSNTLVGEREREISMRLRELMLERDRPVFFDPNLRLGRWGAASAAVAAANACVPSAMLVRCNRVEAELMTGERDPDAAARALLDAGARMAVVTLGADGAILRGELTADAEGVPAEVVSTMGAGDALMGVLLARLDASGFYPPAVAVALPDAVAEAARTCERWSAV
ncbi:MAG TPA: PfkB family carbohydrate kinase [Solirubrobacteraceae bacterium]|nr:PfkB family carbohydrate kinase [Solirubrobacteraceae bacterium]